MSIRQSCVPPERVAGLFRVLAAAALAAVLSACHQAPRTGLDFEGDFPARLSEWRILARDGERLTLNERVTPYDLNSALFSDYAHKLRTVLTPPGSAVRYGEENFEFPLGAVITKTFYYPRAQGAGDNVVRKVLEQEQGESLDLTQVRLLETRLLVNTSEGWIALPYVWDDAQEDATLELAGAALSLELAEESGRTAFTYLVPDANQCAGCHAVEHHEQTLKPIGPKARHLNRDYRYAGQTENQLVHWRRIGLLSGGPPPDAAPRNARWDEPGSGDLAQRARAYLDVNCGHCHNPSGPANTSGLLLHAGESDPAKLGVCKIPIATGRGSGGALFDIVPGQPDASIFLHRMASTEPDVAMPELGRSLIHAEGLALIREWIAALSGACEQATAARSL